MSATPQRTVIVLDDDPVVRDSLTTLLQVRSYNVIDFASGRELLAHDPPLQADCLLVDVHMPEMSGIDVLKALRGKGNRIPTIVLTGRNDATIMAQARELGVVAVLDKPVSHTVLFAALDKIFAAA